MRDSYYKPSGLIGAKFFLFFILTLIIGVPILSVAYIYLIHYIPFIYLNIFFALGIGALLGYLILLAAKHGKARNPLVVCACALVAVVLMKYIQWCIYIPMVLDDVFGMYEAYGINMTFWGRFTESLHLFAAPGEVYDWASAINEVGVWGIRARVGAEVSDTVKGAMLLMVWAMEFLIMAITSISISRSQPKSPFSEESNDWYVDMGMNIETDIPADFSAIKNNAERGNFNDIVQLARAGRTNNSRYLRLSFLQPPRPSSSEPCYIKIVQITADKKNKGKTKALVRYLVIDANSLNEISASTRQFPVAESAGTPNIG